MVRPPGLNKVERIFPPEVNTRQVLWTGEASGLVERTYNTLKELKFI